MEMLISAVIGDLISRSMSFVVGKYSCKQDPAEENLQRLHRLLQRACAIVEEAEGRHVTNQGMLQQLKSLRDEMFEGFYLLDSYRFRAIQDQARDEVSLSHSFALSRFNPSKRLRFQATTDSPRMPFSTRKVEDLQKMVHGLESVIEDTKEFVIFLMHYPRMYRQPYSAHMILDKCIFGRHMERERIIEFLMGTDPFGGEQFGVLPIVGSRHVGKSTLVEHVCIDERVRNHFSEILFYYGNDLKDEITNIRDSCTVRHQNHASSFKRCLLIIELSRHATSVDEASWRRLCSSEICMARGSKIIITSRHEMITSFGTTQSLRVRPLPYEAYWYFFKVLVFGSTNPEDHAKLASIAMEIAYELRGSFMYANVIGSLLRDNFNTQSWYAVLTLTREYMQKNLFLFGEHPNDHRMKNHPLYTCTLPKPSKHFLLYPCYQKDSPEEKVPEITLQDMISGNANARGNVNVLVWRSHIPPCNAYISRCFVPKPKRSNW